MTLDITKMRLSTKGLVAFLIGLGSLLQIPAIETPLLAAAKQHPHVATILAALTGVAAVLHNPKVEKLLGIQTTTDTLTVGDVSAMTSVAKPVAIDAIAAVPSVPASELLPNEPTAVVSAVITKS